MPNEVTLTVKAADKASSTIEGIKGKVGGLTSMLGPLAAAAGAAAIGFASFKTVEDMLGTTQALGQAVNKLSRETGLAAEDASRLLFAFKHVGLDVTDASKSLGIFSKNMTTIAEAEEGEIKASKTTVALLKEMGIQALDSSGNVRPMSELLYEVADQFKDMPNGIEKTGTAMQMFGRSGKDMIPLLNLGSDGMKELAKTADKLGVTLSADNVQKVKDYTYAQRDLKEAITGLKLTIGMELMPQFTKLSQWLVANQPRIREGLVDAIAEAKEKWAELRPELEKFIDYLQSDVLPAVKAVVAFFQEHWPEIEATVKRVMDELEKTFGAKLKIIADIVTVAMAVVQGDWGAAWKGMKTLAIDVINDIIGAVEKMINAVLQAPQTIDSLLGKIPGIGELIPEIPEIKIPRIPTDGGTAGAIGRGSPKGAAEYYQHGGLVPGPLGTARLAVLHGGEEVLTAAERRQGAVVNNYNSTVEMHVTINGSSDEALGKFEQLMNKTLRRAGYGGSSISAGAFIPA